MLICLMYRSELTCLPTEEVLHSLMTTSVENNKKNDLSGLLLIAGTQVLQIIEGPGRALVSTMEKIRSDDRHKNFTALSMGRIQERAFPDWHMMNEVLTAKAAFALDTIATPAGVFEPISEFLSPDVHARLDEFMGSYILDPLGVAA